MTLGLAQRQGDLLDEVTRFCDESVADDSVFALLHRERDNLFPDEFFADLFTARGRRSVPPSIVATASGCGIQLAPGTSTAAPVRSSQPSATPTPPFSQRSLRSRDVSRSRIAGSSPSTSSPRTSSTAARGCASR